MITVEYANKLIEKGLKVTPQRIAVLEAIYKLNNHPSAEKIIEYVRKRHPNIAVATVYKVLNVLFENGLINKVKTDNDSMRYDPVTENHHHLYFVESDEIKDYYNEELDKLLSGFFKKHNIPDFEINGIRLQITGKFKKTRNT